MKTNLFQSGGRTLLATLFLTSSVVFGVLAMKTDALNSGATRSPVKFLGGSGQIAGIPHANVKQPANLAIATASAITPAPTPAAGEHLGFEIFEAPHQLVTEVTQTQGPGANVAAYIAHDAGEPSIGVNFFSSQDPVNGMTAFQSDIQTAFIKFDDSCPTNGQKATWYMSQAPTAEVADQDPIGFTDRQTGRTFSAQLTLLSPTCKVSFTDTDGKDPAGMPDSAGWTPSQGAGIPASVDHETIGGGPYAAPIPARPPGTIYPNAVYYASQSLVVLNVPTVSRSDDGGLTYGPGVETTSACGGLHGHLKVAPDGTVFIPNNACSGQGAVIVSENNGITWTIRPVPGTTTGFSDPAVGIDTNGRVYFAIANGDGKPVVATSDDHGQTWQHVYDVGSALGVKTTAYPAAVAGDAGRAAVAFYGSTTAGNGSGNGLNGFHGVWHLYIAETFDGGQTWTTVDATPNKPIQRGCIWNGGGADICRNLLDFFDMTVDKQGRVEVGYVDGCADGACGQAVSDPNRYTGNGYTARGSIARQSSGKRLFAANDPVGGPTVPGMPQVTEVRIGSTIRLGWSQADDGGSPITGYQIYRGTASGAETLLTTVAGSPAGGSYSDLTATDTTKTYYYRVVAMNAVGSSCGNNEIAAPYVGNACTGLIVQKTPAGHPEQTAQGQAPASLSIDYVAVGEPPNTNDLMFQMKVSSLSGGLPPSSRWRMVWDTYAANGQQFYVGMRTDSSSNPTFEYGTLATAVVGLVVGVPTETKIGSAVGNFNSDGTITVSVPKSAVGNPQPGDLLGAVNGRTFTGDTSDTQNLERSTLLVDHTFVKGQRDNGDPAATYTILGNAACEGGIVPLSAVSRKSHDSIAQPFDIDLPLSGSLGIECRKGQGANSDQHQVVVTFPVPISVSSATVSGTATVSNVLASGNQVFVDLAGVANTQRLIVTLVGVNDGTNIADVSVPMGVLLGDTNGDGFVNSADIGQTKAQSGQALSQSNFREDVNVDGFLNSADIGLVKSKSGTALPPQ
jgi:hypothetical protein